MIRTATILDAEAVSGAWEALHLEQSKIDARFALADDAVARWQNDFKEWVDATDVRKIVVAEEDGEIVGFASAQLWWPPPVYEQAIEVYLDELFVAPESRRRGIGTRLLEDIAAWARGKQAKRVRLGALAANDEAIEFWRQRGANEFLVAMLLDVAELP